MSDLSMKSILNFKKPPILFLGSGITRRYSTNAPCWMELLERIGQRIGITDMNPLKNDAERNSDNTGVMPRLATELQIELDRKLRAGNLKIEDVLNEKEMEFYIRRDANAVKIMAATECSDFTINVDSPLQEEIQYLRKLPNVIPCVITTNYDTMIENDLFEGKFKTYSQISDYYLSGSQGIGEIYKIHGSCTDPSTIILDDNDYKWFCNRAHIVSAKILSVLCDYPMVIIGYAVEDHDIKEILNNLISSLNDEKLREVENNIVFIEYDPNESNIIQSTRDVEYENHVMSLKSLRTNNFLSIFKEISSMEASVSPETIRKIRQVVKKVQITEKSLGERYKSIGIDDISKEDANKLVVVITDRENLKTIEHTPSLSVDSMIRDILGISCIDENPETIVRLFKTYGSQLYSENEYVPIFHYMNQIDTIPKTTFVTDFIENKDKQFRKKLETIKIPKTCNNEIRCREDVIHLIDDSKEYLRPLIVIYAFDKDMISEEDAIACLRHIYEKRENEKLSITNMGCAVSYIGYKKFKSSRDSQMNCNNPELRVCTGQLSE